MMSTRKCQKNGMSNDKFNWHTYNISDIQMTQDKSKIAKHKTIKYILNKCVKN